MWFRLLIAALIICVVLVLAAKRSEHTRPIQGFIEPDVIPVTSVFGGRVAEVLVGRGDKVRAGQELARFEAGELKERVAQLRASLARFPRSRLSAATSLIERVPASTWANLSQTDPARMAAEAEYINALRESEQHPSPESRARLRKARVRRLEVYRHTVEPNHAEVEAFRKLTDGTRETASWLDAQMERFRVRAPVDGIVEMLDVAPGDVLPPRSGVALIDVPNRFVVEAATTAVIAVGTKMTVVTGAGVVLHGVVTAGPHNEFLGMVENPGTAPKPGDAVQLLF